MVERKLENGWRTNGSLFYAVVYTATTKILAVQDDNGRLTWLTVTRKQMAALGKWNITSEMGKTSGGPTIHGDMGSFAGRI